MCLVIDTNSLSYVFNSADAKHEEFKPVFDWIMNGKGKVIFGGSKYKKELGERYLKLFVLLKSQNKAISISDREVDDITDLISKKIVHPDFDDQHIVGLLLLSKCKLVCSVDKRAYSYFRHSLFFSPASSKPRIYSSLKTSHLLSDRYIVDICNPCIKANNETKEKIKQAIQKANSK